MADLTDVSATSVTATPLWTTAGSIAKLLAWRVDEDPGHEFFYVEDDGPWSYRTVAAESVRLSTQLTAAGVATGDLVVVRMGNDERFAAAVQAVWLAGAGVIAMHPSAPAADVVDVGASMGAVALVADGKDPALAVSALPAVRSARYGPAARDDDAELAAAMVVPEVDGAAAALVLLTSGSTGKPKGVVLSHDNAWSNLRSTVSAFRSDTSPTPLPAELKPPNLVANPLSHTAGVVRLLFALYVGRTVALLGKFDGGVAKRLLDRHGIDHLTINPTMMRLLLDQVPDGQNLGAVRYVSSGTAPLPAALREEFEARFGVPVLQAYGQTEAFGGIAIESVRDVLSGKRRPGSVGKPLPGVALRIVDVDGVEVPQGEIGELLVRSESSTSAYVDADARSPLDDAGWLRTGDQGRVDPDGYLYITGRIKNIIICGGFNVVPEEIEAALALDDQVREATVVGVADEKLGEIPVALVEADRGSDDADILRRVTDRLAPYKRPRKLFIVSQLPRVPNGKVDRPAATELARSLAHR